MILNARIFRRRLYTLFRQPIFISLTLWGHGCIIIGTSLFYWFEHPVNPRVQSLLDAVVWSVATVTTVGGEIVPVTEGGKIVSVFVMVLGSIFLWSYTALFAGALVAPELNQVSREVSDVRRELKSEDKNVHQILADMERLVGELREHSQK